MGTDPEKIKSMQKSTARARMFYATHIRWMAGYLLERKGDGNLIWQCFGSNNQAERIIVDSERLYNTRFTWNKLTTHFPRVLDKALPNLNYLNKLIPNLFDIISQLFQQQIPLPALPPLIENKQKIQKKLQFIGMEYPLLKPIAESFVWIYILEPDKIGPVLEIFSKKAAAYEGIIQSRSNVEAIEILHHLLELALGGYWERPEILVLKPYLKPVHARIKYDPIFSAIKKQKAPAAIKEDTAFHHHIGILAELFKFKPKMRRLVCRLLDLLFGERILQVYEDRAEWGNILKKKLTQVSGILKQSKYQSHSALQKQLEQKKEEIKAHAKKEPPTWEGKQVLDLMNRLTSGSDPDGPKLLPLILDIIAQLPEMFKKKPIKHALFIYLCDEFLYETGEARRWQLKVYKALSRYLRQNIARFCHPFYHQNKNGNFILIDSMLTDLDQSGRPEALLELMQAQVEYSGRRSPFYCRLTLILGQWITKQQQINRMMQPFSRRQVDHYGMKSIKLAAQLAADPSSFSVLLQAIDSDLSYEQRELLINKPVLYEQVEWKKLVGAYIERKEIKILLKTWEKYILLQRIEIDIRPPLMTLYDTAVDYPAELSRYMNGIIRHCPEKEKRAREILSRHFPDKPSLLKEKKYLVERLAKRDSLSLQKRLQKIVKQLDNPPALSQRRSKNLQSKLIQLFHRGMLEKWDRMLSTELQKSFPDTFGTQNHSLEDRILTLLNGFHALDDSDWEKSKGIELLLNYRKGEPVKPHEDQANRRFIQRMADKGIFLDPWVDGCSYETRQLADGRSVRIGIERDLLEIFFMGGYFSTCLSPGDINYFSVVANYIDVNKQVLFCRDEKNRVLGRCLMALTDDGGLLLFFPYSHDKSIDFPTLAKQFGEKLAKQLKAMITKDGQVATLASRQWYDDGPRDLSHSFPCLDKNSAFRRNIPDMTAKTFLKTLERDLQPQKINSLTLPLILNLEEIRDRPDLFISLLPRIRCIKQFPLNTLIAVLTSCYRHRFIDDAERLLRKRILLLISDNPYLDHLPEPLLFDIVKHSPSLMLKILRTERTYAVKKDLDEDFRLRVRLFIQAFRQLNRTNKMEQMQERLKTI